MSTHELHNQLYTTYSSGSLLIVCLVLFVIRACFQWWSIHAPVLSMHLFWFTFFWFFWFFWFWFTGSLSSLISFSSPLDVLLECSVRMFTTMFTTFDLRCNKTGNKTGTRNLLTYIKPSVRPLLIINYNAKLILTGIVQHGYCAAFNCAAFKDFHSTRFPQYTALYCRYR